MASETTPELEALVLGLFEVGAVKVRASLSLRACTCMLVTGRFGWKGLGLGYRLWGLGQGACFAACTRACSPRAGLTGRVSAWARKLSLGSWKLKSAGLQSAP